MAAQARTPGPQLQGLGCGPGPNLKPTLYFPGRGLVARPRSGEIGRAHV